MAYEETHGVMLTPYIPPTLIGRTSVIDRDVEKKKLLPIFRNVGEPSEGSRGQKAKAWDMDKPESSKISSLWPYSISKNCCIYRVPSRLRRVNPDAYTPQMVLIGPLQHSKIAQALDLSRTDLRYLDYYLDYTKMDLYKKRYVNDIANMYGVQTIQEFRRIIKKEEQFIRESYSESTDWIQSHEFVEMILQDSVFILVFLLRTRYSELDNKGDIFFQEPCLVKTIFEDLILFESQLPYKLLEILFQPFLFELKYTETFRDIVLGVFDCEGKIGKENRFWHFTDLLREVRVETLGLGGVIPISRDNIKSLHNADKLDSAGVDFVKDDESDVSLKITFKDGILKMPCFIADDNCERVMRNLMALEQCIYTLTPYVCNYISFLDYLIDSEEDVDLLVKKGLVKNWLGHKGSVAEMVNKLCLGLVEFGSYYCPISENLNKYYKSRFNRSLATLRRVYFKDLWTGTATVAAVVLLVLTLIQTVASVLQVKQNNNNPAPSPARKP